jgi:bifunctional non-homologous end joining protein LigD
MGLTRYKEKRNFRRTPEPVGKSGRSVSKLSFVIQRHKASHLHYDFRLEMEGVLKSWAVPKGPSMNPGDKRLAMMVEDHPYDYKDFEGIIPEGNYGAGIVEIWDNGFYSDLSNSEKKIAEKKLLHDLKAGSLKFRLYGKKLKGEFALVKIKGRGENAWLLIKHRDEFAVDEDYNSEEKTPKNSPINVWLRENRPGKLPAAKKTATKKSSSEKKKYAAESKAIPAKKLKSALPGHTRKVADYVPPMLAKETVAPFDDKDWIYEIKWDGYRAIAELKGQEVKLYSRNGNSFNNSYPEIVDALANMNLDAVLDGEIVALDEEGLPSFQYLQHYNYNRPLLYYVFDVLFIKNKNLCKLPLTERKKQLKKLLKKSEIIRYSDHIVGEGTEFYKLAGKQNLEGIMAKRADSEYFPGIRTSSWLKIKHHKTQEAIIAGFTAPGGSRKHFGALVLAVRKGNKLKYIGHTGTGFNDATLLGLSKLLKPLITKESPFEEAIKTNMAFTPVKPVLVCEVKFTEITHDGKLRHPVFLRLRDDKTPKEVTGIEDQIIDVKRKRTKAKKQ